MPARVNALADTRVPLGPKTADKGSAAEPSSDVELSHTAVSSDPADPPASHANLGWREGLGRDTREGNKAIT